jgi:hypothetical protein
MCAWRLTSWSFLDGLPKMSNCYCHPGKAGGTPGWIRGCGGLQALQALRTGRRDGVSARNLVTLNFMGYQMGYDADVFLYVIDSNVYLAPQVGLEPTTLRLTGALATMEHLYFQ